MTEFPFLTDNLVSEFQTDIGVLVPTCLTEPIAIKLLQTSEFLFQVERLAEIDNMVTHARYHLNGSVGKDVDLLYLTAPQGVGNKEVTHTGERLLGIFPGDSTRSHYNLVGIVGIGHNLAVFINIIVFPVVGLDTDDGHALAQRDMYTTRLN